MKAQAGPGGLALVERDVPEPGRNQVILEVHAAGICGTDLHIEAGEYPVPLDVVLGHEVAGVVVAIGANVAHEWLGQRVVSETFFSTCGECDRCREGRVNLCPERKSIGTHVDGAFTQNVAVPVANLHPVPDWLSAAEASLTEPLACVCWCMLEPAVVTPGDRVLVIGPGPIGLLAAQVAALTAREVVVAGLPSDETRLAIAEGLGLRTVTKPDDLGTFDVVVECSGSASGAVTAFAAVRSGGSLIQLGLFGRDVAVPLDQAVMKEIAYRTGFATCPPAWKQALGLIERRDIDLRTLVSGVVPLASFEQAFAAARRGVAAKVVFDPRLDTVTTITPATAEGGVASHSP